MKEHSGSHRLGFMIPMILFVLFFVVCCGAMVGLFARSADISAQAGRKSDAVQICRNQAERFRESQLLTKRCYFDETYHEVDERTGAKYYTECATDSTCCPNGEILEVTITVYSMDDTPIYSLNTSRYDSYGR